jgi:hypothetical protein
MKKTPTFIEESLTILTLQALLPTIFSVDRKQFRIHNRQ